MCIDVCVYICEHVCVFCLITSALYLHCHLTITLCFNFGKIMHLPLHGSDEIVLCFLFHSLGVVLSLKKGAHPKNVHAVGRH